MRRMAEHNARPDRSFDMRPNYFLDVDAREFRQVYTGAYPSGEQSWNVSKEILKRNSKKNKEKSKSISIKYGQNLSLSDLANQSNLKTFSSTARILTTLTPFPEDIDIDWSFISGKVKFQGTCGACYAFTAV